MTRRAAPSLIRTRFFFFQAEDGIRDTSVTGVQTCALPISVRCPSNAALNDSQGLSAQTLSRSFCGNIARRSEERRVGKECRSRGWQDHLQKNQLQRGRRVVVHEAADVQGVRMIAGLAHVYR